MFYNKYVINYNIYENKPSKLVKYLHLIDLQPIFCLDMKIEPFQGSS